MRMTEFIAFVNKEMPKYYVSSHVDMPLLRANKKVKKFIREKNKVKKIKNGIEDVDIFGVD